MRILLLAALLSAQPTKPPANPPPRIDHAAERAAIARYQAANQRLQDAGWRLARANAPFCAKVVPSIGLQMHDMASYGGPDAVRAALNLARDFAVQSAASGSPAALSGAFPRNREVVGLESLDLNLLPATPPLDWRRVTRAQDHLDAMLAAHGAITVAFADGGEARVAAVDVCASRFDLSAGERSAFADGARVIVGINSPAHGYDDATFTALIAHELAHNVLGHDAWLDRNDPKRRNARNVRRIEREADRLVPWLLGNAGYDPAAGPEFMTRWGSKHDAGLRLRRNHEGWDERAEHMAAEVSLVRELLAREGKADWAKHFRREIEVPL